MASPKKRYDVCAGRPYGEDKKHWIQVGKLTEWDDGGFSIEMHAFPTGNWFDGRLSCFEQKPKEGEQQRPERARPQRQVSQQSGDGFEDSTIPF